MAFWGVEIKPKKPLPLSIERRLVIKQAALVIEKPSSEPCVLSVSVAGSDQQFVVCRLHEGRLEHCTLELPFSPSDNATLHLKGPHTIHLTGFLELEDEDEFDEMDQAAASGLGGLEDEDDDEEDDDDFDEDGEEDGEDEDEDEGEEDDDDDDDDEELDDIDDDESEEEEEEVVLPPPKKKAKKEAPSAPAAAPAKASKGVTPPSKGAKGAAAAPTSAKKETTPAAKTPSGQSTAASSPGSSNPWSKDEEAKFKGAMASNGPETEKRWEKIAAAVGTRNKEQCKKKHAMDKKK